MMLFHNNWMDLENHWVNCNVIGITVVSMSVCKRQLTLQQQQQKQKEVHTHFIGKKKEKQQLTTN